MGAVEGISSALDYTADTLHRKESAWVVQEAEEGLEERWCSRLGRPSRWTALGKL